MKCKTFIKSVLLSGLLVAGLTGCFGNNDSGYPNSLVDTNSNISKSSNVNLGDLNSTGMKTNLLNASDSSFSSAIYASPNGSSSNNGTSNKPYDLLTALEKVNSGKATTILLKEGTYSFDEQINIESSGSKNAYNVLKASEGASVVLDFSKESYSTTTSKNDRGLQLNGNYWYIGKITIQGAADNGLMISGNNNVIERCIFDGNRDTGLQISRKNSSLTDFNDWPSNNYVINCTSKNNCDPATYENADGFASKLTCGNGNVFDGCISYNNSDDGWDLYAKSETGPIGIVTIRNCISMRNGETEDGTTKSSCDGNGFKLGGGGVGTPHIIQNCLSIENLHHGFTDNNNPSALSIANCTAFDNNQGGSKNNFSIYRCDGATVSNCVSYTTNNSSDKFKNLKGDHIVYSASKKWYKVTNQQDLDSTSSETRGIALSSGITSSDFQGVTIPSVGTDFDKKWRNSDGTINTNGIGILASTSDYAEFASDGSVIGARFGSNNNTSKITLKINGEVNNDDSNDDSDDDDNSSSDDNTSSSTLTHNFTTSDLSDSFFTISGNLSTSKGTVTYNGLTLTQCLKIESSTSIKFTSTASGTLTMVFNTSFNKNIKIDGTKYNVSNGILAVDLSKGSHTITKADTCNLYYISLDY